MGPVEILFASIGAIVTMIGLARGYAKELGTTLILMVNIFVLTFFKNQIGNIADVVVERLLAGVSSPADLRALTSSLIFQLIFVSIVFASYAGKTLDFTGKPLPAPQGLLLNLAIGLLNGYLIAGTLWYYLDEFDYPIQGFGLIRLPLTAAAEQMVNYLPQRLFESPVYWMVPVAVLLILRVRG
jgi:hypothetical protein